MGNLTRIQRISCPFIDLEGFGEGHENNRLYWYRYSLPNLPSNLEFTDKDWFSIECFQVNARELLSNIADLNLPNGFHLSIDNTGPKTSIESNIYPGKHRAKSLFMDFRHFTLKQDPSHFNTVANIVKKALFHRPEFRDQIVEKSNNFRSENISINERVTSDLLDLWFYSEYFHRNNEAKVDQRRNVLNEIHEESVVQALSFEVIQRSFAIKSIYVVIKDLSKANKVLNIHNPGTLEM